jgi:hypothetical protein
MPARGKFTAEMPRKWVSNAAKRSSGFHETQNAFCLVKALIARPFPTVLREEVWDCGGAALGRPSVIG